MKILLVTSPNEKCGIRLEPTEVTRLNQSIARGEGGCWLWVGTKTIYGYGQFVIRRRSYRAHRLVYALLRGDPPPILHHVCRNKLCVNPDHLQPASSRENALSGTSPCALNAQKTHCLRGHPLAGDNVRIKKGRGTSRLRVCRTCAREEAKRRYRLFSHYHSLAKRHEHWEKAKDPLSCPECAAFLSAVKEVSA